MYDEKNDVVTHPVEITKVDADTGTELAGATLCVTEKATMSTMAEWMTDGSSHKMNLPAGTYTLTEIKAPDGYEVAKPIDFEVDSTGKVKVNGVVTNAVEMKDIRVAEVTVSKIASDTNAALEGAVLQIKQGDTVIQEWTTGDQSVKFKLPAGTYTLHEKSAPNENYLLANDIDFTIDIYGNITVDKAASNGNFVLTDLRIFDVPVNKTASDTKVALPDAQLEIWDVNHTRMLDSWTTDGTTHTVRLTEGTYKLHEETPPSGYLPAQDITFTVNKDGTFKIGDDDKTVTSIDMVDTLITGSVTIRKVDADDTTKDLTGAHLVITDANGNIVAEWDADGAARSVENLKPGTYTLTETVRPTGYDLANPIVFKVESDGSITVNGEKVTTIVMEDVPITGSVSIRKVDADDNSDLSGAHLVLTDANDKVIAEWDTNGAARSVENLKPGTYTLTETKAPDDYDIADAIHFEVDTDGKVYITDTDPKTLVGADGIVMKDAKTPVTPPTPPTPTKFTVTIRKVDSDKRDANLPGATLVVKKGDTIVEKWVTGNAAHTLDLEPGTYTLSEISAPDGYDVAADIEFTVTEDGKVTINKEPVEDLTVTMTDKKKQTSTPTPTPVETPTPTPNTTTPTPTPAPTPKPTPVETPTPTATPAVPQQPATTIPRTADDYPLIPLVIAFLASGAALTLGFTKKRKHHN